MLIRHAHLHALLQLCVKQLAEYHFRSKGSGRAFAQEEAVERKR
ncbi:hypothetical protein GNIT_2735 [Glaciecola nitratireducens FR1064]|uniref:Uncharacterized protein n=1 Tax=Glaciecola nitratireducens (strain JCM 12485 / KCTC 12276 / FR1064) TaxID=1085623 RepID=G4QIB8_GLANF|nr:hypothetical protein GNIT_2735 [Glaciecola nitratireducens FR1064]